MAIPNLDEIVALARQQVALEELIADLEGSLATLKADLVTLQQEALPAAMAEAGVQKLVLDSGETINIKPDFVVGIPLERREEAFDWLTVSGYESLIKTQVSASFGKGELARAMVLLKDLSKRKYMSELHRDVHWQTLKAFVAESVREKRKIPMDLFGAVPMNKAIIKAKG